eukprot:6220961-Pyramimonas_sp.AAC.1
MPVKMPQGPPRPQNRGADKCSTRSVTSCCTYGGAAHRLAAVELHRADGEGGARGRHPERGCWPERRL